jgi:hypothetical protein
MARDLVAVQLGHAQIEEDQFGPKAGGDVEI